MTIYRRITTVYAWDCSIEVFTYLSDTPIDLYVIRHPEHTDCIAWAWTWSYALMAAEHWSIGYNPAPAKVWTLEHEKPGRINARIYRDGWNNATVLIDAPDWAMLVVNMDPDRAKRWVSDFMRSVQHAP